MALHILAWVVAAQLAAGARVDLPVTHEQLETAEHEGVAEILQVLDGADSNPEMTTVKFGVQLGKKPAGSNSLKGKLSLLLKDIANETKPPEKGYVPVHCEIVTKTSTERSAKKLVSNLQAALDIFPRLASMNSSGSSITVAFDDLVPFDEDDFEDVKVHIGKARELSLSEDLYVDLDKWVKEPKLMLLDVFSGMRVEVTAVVAKGIIQALQELLKKSPAGAKLDPKAAEKLSMVGDAPNETDQEVTLPGFDKAKQKLSVQYPGVKKTYKDAEEYIEALKLVVIPKVIKHEESHKQAVAAVNLLEQMAAADLWLSGGSCSLFSGSIRLALAVEYYPLVSILAKTVKATGVRKLVYGKKKPEEYGIPGVESEETVQAMHNAAFAAMRPSAVLGVLVLIAGWAM